MTLHSALVIGARDVRPSLQEAQTRIWQGTPHHHPIRSPPALQVQPNTRQYASWTQIRCVLFEQVGICAPAACLGLDPPGQGSGMHAFAV
jgi:hypothetical protein